MRHVRPLLVTAACITAFAFAPAHAQSNREVADRMEKVERDLMTVQKMLARSGSDLVLESTSGDTGIGAASMETRLSTMEEDVRALRGKVEEVEFQNRKLSDTLTKFQQDVDFRLNELATKAPQPVDNSLTSPAEEKLAPTETEAELPPPAKGKPAGKTPEPPVEEEAVEAPPTPRDHYNQAFRLLNQTRYDAAATSFKDFIEKYPKDPLIGNAHYWLGETHYIRRDYVKAADQFREGFEVLPNGPKAADNLLKLSMSLSAMKKNKEACVVLDQLLLKFKETSSSVAQKAEAERGRIGCK